MSILHGWQMSGPQRTIVRGAARGARPEHWWGNHGGSESLEGCGGFVKRDLAIIRAIEVVVALVIVFVLYSLLSAGALGSIGRFATGWYSQKMDGIFTISVIDKSIQLPHLDKANLPIAMATESIVAPEAPSPPAPLEPAEDAVTLSAT